MKKQIQNKMVWPVGMFVAGVVLLVFMAGCIRVSVNVTESRPCSPGQPPVGHPFPPIGSGNFVPGQGTGVDAGTGATICGHPVTKKVPFTFVFNGQTYSTNVAPTGTKGFLGTIIDLDNTNALIDNSHFILHLFATGLKKNCCTNVLGSTTQVGTNVWAGYGIQFTAYFKQGFETEAGHRLKVDGEWTQ